MFNHVGVTINNFEDIENFYKNVLLFEEKSSFHINNDISNKIFNINNITNVYLLQYKDMVLEVFLDTTYKKVNTFSHICISYPNASDIYKNSCDYGYKCYSHGQTYFIYDHSDNIYEIKTKIL